LKHKTDEKMQQVLDKFKKPIDGFLEITKKNGTMTVEAIAPYDHYWGATGQHAIVISRSITQSADSLWEVILGIVEHGSIHCRNHASVSHECEWEDTN
jgi:hypothetical protein